MAENEVLDVGNRRHYRQWREALADPNLSGSEVAEPLVAEFPIRLGGNLRRAPLPAVLKACGSDRQALQDAVANLKYGAMAKCVERAYRITKSTNPLIVGQKISELLIDGLIDKANRYAVRQSNTDRDRFAELEHGAAARLEACKPEIVRILVASLQNEPIRRTRSAPEVQLSAASLVSLSLLRPAEIQPRESPNG
ncbi:MAG: hypothetical protein ABI748_08220 [Dokdonella sp.]